MASIIKSFKILSDPTRLRLLLLIDGEELSVAEIQDILGMGQSRISSHLAQLKRAGLLADRRAGKHIFYRRADQGKSGTDARLRDLIVATAAEIPEAAADRSALKVTLRRRRDKARTYFDQIAGRFGRSYCPGRSWEAMAHLALALIPPVVVADLGAGEGMLSQLLARRAKKVIAIDSSENMVAYGSELARQHRYENIEYRLGDLEDPPIEPRSTHLAVFSQALHHAASPERALAAAHRILRPGGRVVVLDLLSHQFEEARELYADLWMGFTEAEMHRMLEKAGFTGIEISAVAREPEPPHFQTLFATAVK
jgi:ArsR family transcriptional regulator